MVSTDFDLNIYKLAHTWSFLQRDKGCVGLTAGLYVADVGTTLAAASIGETSGNGLAAPHPVFGVSGQYDLADRWTLRSSAELFALEGGDFSGSLYNLSAGPDCQLRDNIAAGLGIDSASLDVGVDWRRFNGDSNWRYTGGPVLQKFDF
jgi:hypothetical protein